MTLGQSLMMNAGSQLVGSLFAPAQTAMDMSGLNTKPTPQPEPIGVATIAKAEQDIMRRRSQGRAYTTAEKLG